MLLVNKDQRRVYTRGSLLMTIALSLMVFACPRPAIGADEEFPVSLRGSFNAGKRIQSVAFSSDGHWLAAGTDDGQVLEVDLTKPALIPRSLNKQQGKLVFVAFGPGDTGIITASENGTLTFIPLSGDPSSVNSVKTKAKVRTAAVAISRGFLATGFEKTVKLRNLSTFEEVAVLPHESRQEFVALQFTPSGDWLVGLCKDGSMWKWKTTSPLEGAVRLPSTAVNDLHAANASGCSNVMSISTEVTGLGRDPNANGGTGGGYRTIQTTSDAGQSSALRVGNQTTGAGPGVGMFVHAEIKMYDLDRSSALPSLEIIDSPINGLAFSSDNRLLASIRGSFVDVHEVQNGNRVVSLPLAGEGSAVAFDPKGQWMATATARGEISVYSVGGIHPGTCFAPSPPKMQITSPEKTPLLVAAKNLRLAVVDFDANSVDAGLARTITETIRSRIRKPPDVEVVERKELTRMLQELHLSMTDLIDPKNAVKLGNGVSANRFLYGSVNKVAAGNDEKFATYRVNVRLVDVTTTLIGGEREVTCRPCTADDLLDAADLLAKALIN